MQLRSFQNMEPEKKEQFRERMSLDATWKYIDALKSIIEYDEVEVCAESAETHPKSAILVRNRTLVDRSDLIICCIQRKSGGAYKTMQYAEKQGKHIINLVYE